MKHPVSWMVYFYGISAVVDYSYQMFEYIKYIWLLNE